MGENDDWTRRQRQYRWLCLGLWLAGLAVASGVAVAHRHSHNPDKLAGAVFVVAVVTGLMWGAVALYVGRVARPPGWSP